jgi:hypothetical protein
MSDDKKAKPNIKPGWQKSELWLSVLWVIYSAIEVLPGTYEWYVKVPAICFALGLIAFWVWKRDKIYSSQLDIDSAKGIVFKIGKIIDAIKKGDFSEALDIISDDESDIPDKEETEE